MIEKFKSSINVIVVVLVVLCISSLNVFADETIEDGQLLFKTNFEDGSALPWELDYTAPSYADASIEEEKFVVEILNVGSDADMWDIQIRHRNLTIEVEHTYTVEFTVKANNNCSIYPRIGDQNDPYYEDWNYNNTYDTVNLTAGEEKTISQKFTANRSAEHIEFAIYLADAPDGTVFEFDNFSLYDPEYVRPSEPISPSPREIRANQLGYFPEREKIATMVSEVETPVDWQLRDSMNNTVASGMTEVFGFDEDSGENVHIIDFSDYSEIGSNYKLYVDDFNNDGNEYLVSYPFDISNDLYDDMLFDSLKYFYHSRSGETILEDYVQNPDFAREAGHSEDIAEISSDEPGTWNYAEDNKVDVTGGWYNSTGYGKFVVYGAPSVWTLQNMYERKQYLDDNGPSFVDNTLSIPESGNGYPDILDETRVHMEAMLKMQIDEGYDREGMVFSRIYDYPNTGIAISPEEATELVEKGDITRTLRPPTTAATLNLAATAAQSYRLWRDYDSQFANKCLDAAERAWQAAVENPDLYTVREVALGATNYEDDYMLDEFYWAAAELYVSTDKEEYKEYLEQSPHFLEVPKYLEAGLEYDTVGPFNQLNTAALGTLTLALVPNELSESNFYNARMNIAEAADFYLDIQDSQGYGIPIEQCKINEQGDIGYPWLSNYYVLNSAIIMGYAYDYTKDTLYLDGMTETYDYLMGRNPMERTYITGYGDYPVENPHHSFFANQNNRFYPEAPAGIVVGGPNSNLNDSHVKLAGMDPQLVPPQKAYKDNIRSWSTNEPDINLNASLAWGLAYLVENSSGDTDSLTLDGDVNDDGFVNSIDIVTLRRYLVGNDINISIKNADTKRDGFIDSLDYAQLRRILLGSIVNDEVITFEDSNLEYVVRDAINKPEGDIYKTDVQEITTISIHPTGEAPIGVSSLKGIENLVNLEQIYLNSTGGISDLSPLSGLEELIYISINGNKVTDLSPLRNLTNLNILHLSYNEISDISPLSNLTGLTELSLYDNQIKDITPLSSLKNLTYLKLGRNQISDISALSNLNKLDYLSLFFNQIEDISPLTNVTSLAGLNLAENEISDIDPLANLSNLSSISIYQNQIRDISALSNLNNLDNLYIEHNLINDISPLSGLEKLTELHLENNQISDISPLSNLNLNRLFIDNNQIRDIQPLLNLNTTRISIQENYLDISEGSEDMEVINELENNGCWVQYSPQKEANDELLEFEVLSEIPKDLKEKVENLSTLRGFKVLKSEGDTSYIYIGSGERNTGGYDINVEEVIAVDDITNITVIERSPDPDDPVTMEITYPHLVVKVYNATDDIDVINQYGNILSELN
ncbi:MAG: glycoside hydrolase family 9 protein [Bacillota bacterium]